MKIINADCIAAMREMPPDSVDAIVTDPPYGLSFMGKKWDYDVPSVDVWRDCLRVLKPGGHLLAFAGTRTQHRMAVQIEDAGFEIRDMIAWVYGSGFPKSLDVSKAIDRAAGAEREVVGPNPWNCVRNHNPQTWQGSTRTAQGKYGTTGSGSSDITAPATPEAQQWAGWGTALKPALEPITMARKPLIGTVAENVLAHGTGALNVDGCRVPTDDNLNGGAYSNGVKDLSKATSYATGVNAGEFVQPPGRWPANLIHDGSDEVVGLFPATKSGGGIKNPIGGAKTWKKSSNWKDSGYQPASEGSAARFFYCAKASKRDRDEGLDHMPDRLTRRYGEQGQGPEPQQTPRRDVAQRNHHPTVKPTALMRYLCRLITPPGGTVLDPFMGSGSTGKAAILEGFNFIGIEREAEYADIARARIEHAERNKAEELPL